MQSEARVIMNQAPSETGELLYISSASFQEGGDIFQVQLCEQCIILDRKQYIIYNFDLKMLALEQRVIFELDDAQLTLHLYKRDHLKWKEILKNYLNQRGFHTDFKPLKKIGKGNFASVYMAENLHDHVRYAVKAFSKEAAFSEENGKQCLIKQIQIMRRLNHKNNMKLHQVYESENSLYIVFQLLQGGQLYDRIKAKHKFTSQQVRKIIQGLLEGLMQMHSKNIMHRDLKPENILFRDKNDYDCVIADYGLSQFCNADKYLFVRCGTPGYVAPEVINIRDMNERYSPICDIFSLGLIFHVLLMGKSIFKGSSYNEVLAQNRACKFDLQSSEYEVLDKESLDLLKKMLKKNPEERITAELALSHPYFKEQQTATQAQKALNLLKLNSQTAQQEDVEQKTLGKWNKRLSKMEKDSCLKLEQGKQNVLLAKTETVNTVNSTKISFVGSGNKKQKISRFARDSHINKA